uniref:Uncharacterized protein n=1 Tax=Ixodes scapularis TaxID=6945 RepID=A0A4D5RF93_IXOSC
MFSCSPLMSLSVICAFCNALFSLIREGAKNLGVSFFFFLLSLALSAMSLHVVSERTNRFLHRRALGHFESAAAVTTNRLRRL